MVRFRRDWTGQPLCLETRVISYDYITSALTYCWLQNIAQEEYGIQGLWATVLGVHENGTRMNTEELESLAEMFVWRSLDMLD